MTRIAEPESEDVMPVGKRGGSNPGERRGGRVKGVPNHLTGEAKEAIALAFAKMGGTDALVKWAKENSDNRRAFYTQIWTKIVPLTVGGDPDSPLTIIERRIVDPAA